MYVGKILQKQQDFLASHTSFQIEGSLPAEMDAKIGNTENTIGTLLLDNKNIAEIEQMFNTKTNGRWLLLIKKNHTEEIRQFIGTNLTKIYKGKGKQHNKLVTFHSI